MTRKRFLTVPVEPFVVEPDLSAAEVVRRMERISFQGRTLAAAHRIWCRMLEGETTIFLGLAGALTAGGLRLVLAYLIRQRYVDCLVSTGANLYHDLHDTRGRRHYIGTPGVSDAALQAEHIDRVYDTFVDEDEFIENDNWIAEFATALEPRPYTSREFLYLLGGRLWEETGADGILTAAHRARVPIFCPAIADSSIGMGLSQARHRAPGFGQIDTIGDIIESANVVARSRETASVVLGGGTPKNFINQACVQAAFFKPGISGHRYAVQIVTDVPHFGGASGSSLDEARSWGKVALEADHATVHADATLALPLLSSALVSTAHGKLAGRRVPQFDLAGRILARDGIAFPDSRFEEPA